MYTVGAFLAPLIMTPFLTLANQNISTGKHRRIQLGPNVMSHDSNINYICSETPCKNTSDPDSNNKMVYFEGSEDDGNLYIFLGII